MLSGGDDAIIIGRLPNGQLARRSARLTTAPEASLAAIASLSLMISGRSAGFGTLSNHSLQFPEPGSWTIHIPVRSTGPCAAAAKHEQNRRIATPQSTISIETKRTDPVFSSDQNMLLTPLPRPT